MIRCLIVLTLLVGYSTSQYAQQQRGGVSQQAVQNVQAAQPEAIDGIPAWYQMSKPVASSRVQQLPQASPSYYERIEPTYEQRRGEQPTFERPGIQTNQYANYPSYQNRQPYENLNALTSGASLSNLQANRRYPASNGGAGGNDMPYDSALKRYHKLLLKRRQWTTKIGRILASTTPMTPSTVIPTTTTTTTEAPTTTTTKKMPKSLKSIYSTIIPKTSTTTEEPTEAPSTTTTQATPRVTPRLVGKPRGTFKPHGTRKGWRMWKKVTPKYAGKSSVTTTEAPASTTITTTEPSTSVTSSSTSTTTTIPELPLIEETEEVTEVSPTTSTITTTEEPTTVEETTTTSTTSTTTESNGSEGPAPLRPITVGHKWKPLRFKKPEPVDEVPDITTTRPKGLRLLEYLLKQTDTFAKGLQKAIDGVSASGVSSSSLLTNEPNTELLAAIKDVVAKFKASLDEAGIDQDVRLMGNQLKNTWQQLRTGPMNEQIGRLFEKAVADAADQKTQQQIQQVQQQIIASRP